MEKIWKFELKVEQEQSIAVPQAFKILTVRIQHGKPHVWVAVDTEAPTTRVMIETFATGQEIPPVQNCSDQRDYIGTYELDHLIFHVYQRLTLLQQ